ncbi:MAG: hypothetical protein H6648_10040 [Caldilineae bacterium]|nr:hypothetical protein [Caldilineae bacterium]
MTLLVANLDCEADWASAWPSSGPSSASAPRPVPLSVAARNAAAIAGSLMRGLATGPEDRLWLAAPLDESALDDGVGLPRPALVGGPLGQVPGTGSVLGWGETPALAALRQRCGVPPSAAARATGPDADGAHPAPEPSVREPRATDPRQLGATLLDLFPPDPDTAARANHRGLSLRMAQEHGWALPGARMLDSFEAIERHLAAGGAASAPEQRWVLKTPLSAAGRDRVHGRGAHLAEPGARRRCVELLRWQGSLRFEPWMTRLDDWGMVGLVDRAGPWPIGLHRQLTDPFGRFQGLELAQGAASIEAAGRALGLPDPAVSTIRTAFEVAGVALAGIGYRGAFGVDAWRYRDPDGRVRMQPLGEINARVTMGLVGQSLIAGIAPTMGWPSGRVRLRLGARRAQEPDCLRLAHSGGFAAWLEPGRQQP